ncbi:MAG: phosphatidylglycerol lysyltransferase domain-containing protein [Bacteroidia bacterium]
MDTKEKDNVISTISDLLKSILHKVSNVIKKTAKYFSDNRKTAIQVIFGLLTLSLAFLFFSHEREEILNIPTYVYVANKYWMIAGVAISVIYVLLQSLLYVYSFKTVREKISFGSAVLLFLKRNFISVFIPAGGFTSLGFFSNEISGNNISKTKIHFASVIYAFTGLLTVVIAAVPILVYLLIKQNLSSNELSAFALLVLLIAVIAWSIYSLLNEGVIAKITLRFFPDFNIILEELKSLKFDKSSFINTIIVSTLIEISGIAGLWIALRAVGLDASLEVACVGYIVTVLILVISPFLRGVGPIDASVALVLFQYGYDKSAAIAAMLIYRLFEFWLPLFYGLLSFIKSRNNFILRIAPPLFILLLGFVNIISAVTPAIPERLRALKNFLPLDAIHFSNYFVLIAGLFLVLTSVFLFRGLRSAWWIAVALSVISVIGNLGKAFDYEEATAACITLFVLLYTHKNYYIKSDFRTGYSGLNVFAISFGAAILFGVTGFYFLDKKHFGVEFNLLESVINVARAFFLLDTSSLHPQTHFARDFLYALYFAGGVSILFGLYSFLKPIVHHYQHDKEEIYHAKLLIEKYGRSPLDHYKTYYDKIFYFSQVHEAFVSYAVSGNFAVVLETPVCLNTEVAADVIKEFDGYCRDYGLKNCYYRVDEEMLPLFYKQNKKSLLIGQEAVVDLVTFTTEGKSNKSLRNAVNKAEKEGVLFKVYQPPLKDNLIQQLKSVSDEWLADGKKETIFSNGVFMEEELKNQTVFTAENAESKIYAFINQIPCYSKGEATYDMIRKKNDAPGVVLDFMMIRMFEYFKSKGFQKVNLGLAPMSGIEEQKDFPHRTVKFAYERIKSFSHFHGLRSFKEKFSPQWLNKYLVYSNSYDLLTIPAALSKVEKNV